jgi:hypothetical protein
MSVSVFETSNSTLVYHLPPLSLECPPTASSCQYQQTTNMSCGNLQAHDTGQFVYSVLVPVLGSACRRHTYCWKSTIAACSKLKTPYVGQFLYSKLLVVLCPTTPPPLPPNEHTHTISFPYYWITANTEAKYYLF